MVACFHPHSVPLSDFTIITLMQSTSPPSILPAPSLQPLTKSVQSDKLSTTLLRSLFGEFIRDSSHPLKHIYGKELEYSRQSLAEEICPTEMSLPPKNYLVGFHKLTTQHLKHVHNTLVNSLSPNDDEELTTRYRSGRWPDLSTRTFLQLLSIDRRGTLLPAWKDVAVKYANAIIANQLSERMLRLFESQQIDDLKRELTEALDVAFNRDILMALYPDWLLIQVSNIDLP